LHKVLIEAKWASSYSIAERAHTSKQTKSHTHLGGFRVFILPLYLFNIYNTCTVARTQTWPTDMCRDGCLQNNMHCDDIVPIALASHYMSLLRPH